MNHVFKNPATAHATIDEAELTNSNFDPAICTVYFSTALRIPSATMQEEPAAYA